MSFLGGAPRAQTTTPEFQRWFGRSKAVDESGQPLIVYHGTVGDFSEFSRERVGSASRNTGFFGDGFYFTDSPEVASQYATKHSGANVIPVYVSISKPLILTEDESSLKRSLNTSRKRLLALHGWTPQELKLISDPSIAAISESTACIGGRRFREVVQSNGFDGVYVRGSTGSMNADEWVAFLPQQIKSAIGNRGTFDPNDPNILHGWRR